MHIQHEGMFALYIPIKVHSPHTSALPTLSREKCQTAGQIQGVYKNKYADWKPAKEAESTAPLILPGGSVHSQCTAAFPAHFSPTSSGCVVSRQLIFSFLQVHSFSTSGAWKLLNYVCLWNQSKFSEYLWYRYASKFFKPRTYFIDLIII